MEHLLLLFFSFLLQFMSSGADEQTPVYYYYYDDTTDDTPADKEKPPQNNQVDLIEIEVLGFRLWMIIAFVLAGLLFIVVLLCCVCDCRIPRTKQQIEADYEQRALLKHYKEQLIQQPVRAPQRARGAEIGAGQFQGTPVKGSVKISEVGLEDDLGEAPLAAHPAQMNSRFPQHRTARPLGGERQTEVGTARLLASMTMPKARV